MLKKILLAMCLGLVAAPLWAQDGALRLSGSTTVLPIAQKAAEAYMAAHPGARLSVSGTGSGDGLKAIIEGATDIANSSRDLKDKEKARAAEAGVALERHGVALDCVAVVVNPQNPVAALSLADLKKIYSGEAKTWKAFGGEDKPIVAVNRDPSSGTFELWLEKVMGGERVRPDAQVQASNGTVAGAVAGNKYAIGYVGLGYLSKDLKAVPVEGVAPSAQTAADGTYPLSRELYMFTRPDGPAAANDFIAFVTGPEGQKIVEEEGFVRLAK